MTDRSTTTSHSGADAPFTLHTADDVELAACWHRSPAPNAAVVLVHGFSAHRSEVNVAATAQCLVGEGFDVLTYDARGHGASAGLCGVGSTEHLDVAAAVDEAGQRGLPVVLVGVSMGGIAVLDCLSRLATPGSVRGAVVVSAPARWRMRPSVTGLLMALVTRSKPGRAAASRWLAVRVAQGWQLGEPTEAMVAKIDVPVAVVHGASDRLLAPRHATLLHQACVGPARLDVVARMGHGLGPAAQDAVLSSVRWVLDPVAAPPLPA